MKRRRLLVAFLCLAGLLLAGVGAAVAASEKQERPDAAPRPEYVQTLFPVRRGGKWGYVDAGGDVVIPLQYDAAQYFSEGLAAVKAAGKWGFLDEKGAAVIPPTYDQAREFSDGLAWVAGGDWAGFIDKTGRQTLRIRWGDASNFREGYAVLSPAGVSPQEGKPRLIDKSGNTLQILRPGVESIAEGKPVPGQRVLEPDAIESFHEGLARVQSDRLYGFADLKGRMVIPPQYEEAWFFREGCAPVVQGGKRFFIGRDGRPLTEKTYEDVQGFQEGLAAVKVGGKWGFINKRGEAVIAPQYEAASSFFCDRAAVKVGDKWGDIDPQGKMVIEPRYADAHFFLGELAAVRFPSDAAGESTRYVNKAGVEVWPAKANLP